MVGLAPCARPARLMANLVRSAHSVRLGALVMASAFLFGVVLMFLQQRAQPSSSAQARGPARTIAPDEPAGASDGR